MPRNRIDGVIEAVRYTQEGKIELVRAYERRGTVWSDNLLLQRAELVKRIAKGKKFYIGRRKAYFGSQLDIAEPVHMNANVITTGDITGTRDMLNRVPTF